MRRALVGLVEIVDNALQTARGLLPNHDDDPGATPELLSITSAVYNVQVTMKVLRNSIENLPQH